MKQKKAIRYLDCIAKRVSLIKVKTSKNYNVKDLLHFAIDHLRTAKYLYSAHPSFYDSAGYLSQLGIEVLLKAWLCYCVGKFPMIHELKVLYENIKKQRQEILLSKDSENWLIELDRYYGLRYPYRNRPIETGLDDWDKTEKLFSELMSNMPQSLLELLESLPETEKGGRILMEKSI